MCKPPPFSKLLQPPRTFQSKDLFPESSRLKELDKQNAKEQLLKIQLLLARRTS